MQGDCALVQCAAKWKSCIDIVAQTALRFVLICRTRCVLPTLHAAGKHIRYLTMGMPFDLIAHPWMLPWAMKYYETFHGRKHDLPSTTDGHGKHIFKLPKGFPSIDGVGRVFDVLGLQRTTPIPYGNDSHNRTNTHCSDNGRIDVSTEQQYAMTVVPVTSNFVGSMHGGAVACAVEHACVLARTRAHTPHTAQSTHSTHADFVSTAAKQGEYLLECFVSGVEVRYINAMKGDLVITTVEDVYAAPLHRADSQGVVWSSKSFGKILNKDGTVCAEYVCTWAMCE